ncbi:hypothetical protein HKX48_006134 [Thoreauomyces humboldtii]|nr:hypothetical protein HKX48_006134 [Thoreauomyces humboldtii]
MATTSQGRQSDLRRSASSPTLKTGSTAADLSTGRSFHNGYLWKRSKTHPSRWLRRHFRYDGQTLTYHHSSSSNSAARLSIPTSRILRVVANPRPVAGVGVNVFDVWVAGGDPPFELACRTRRGMEEWVAVLSRDIGAMWFASEAAKVKSAIESRKASAAGGLASDKVPPPSLPASEGRKTVMPTLPPLPFALDAFGPYWDTNSDISATTRLGKNSSAPSSGTSTPVAPVRTLSRRGPPVPNKDGPTRSAVPSPRMPSRSTHASHSTTDLLSVPSSSVTTSMPSPGPTARNKPRSSTLAAKGTNPTHVTKNGFIGTNTMPRFKSAEKLQALIMALHDTTESARPDGSLPIDPASNLMRDLPPLPPLPVASMAPTVYEPSPRILPPLVITNHIARKRGPAPPPVEIEPDSPDSGQTIIRPAGSEFPSPLRGAFAAASAAVAAIPPPAKAATTGGVDTETSSPLLTSLDPGSASKSQRVAVLTKVVDIVRHGTALHMRLNTVEETERDAVEMDGDVGTLTSKAGRDPTSTAASGSKNRVGPTVPPIPTTHLAARTKARRKALDEYRVSVEDLGRRTRDYIRSLPATDDDPTVPAVANVGAVGQPFPAAAAIDLVESVEVMLMKLAQLREVFADRV